MPKPKRKRKHTFGYYNIVFERCGEKSTARSMTTPMRMNKNQLVKSGRTNT